MLYENECIPISGSSLVFQPTVTASLYHYGPVSWTGAAHPVIIDWAISGSGQWTTLPEEDFSVWQGMDPREVNVSALTPEDFGPGYDYRIRPKPGVLKCAGLGIDVEMYEYILIGE